VRGQVVDVGGVIRAGIAGHEPIMAPASRSRVTKHKGV
jgi:hypothetical protein